MTRRGLNQQIVDMIDYSDIVKLRKLLNNYHDFKELANMGYDVATDICMDLDMALSSHCLDPLQRTCIKEALINGKTQTQIAEDLNVAQSTINKSIKQGLVALSEYLHWAAE